MNRTALIISFLIAGAGMGVGMQACHAADKFAEAEGMNPVQVAASGTTLFVASDVETNGEGGFTLVTADLRVRTTSVTGIVTRGVAALGNTAWFSAAVQTDGDWNKTADFIAILDANTGRLQRVAIPTLGSRPGQMSMSSDGQFFSRSQT